MTGLGSAHRDDGEHDDRACSERVMGGKARAVSEVTVRPELPPMPDRIARLPLDHRGYPVPWFVAWIDGEGNPVSPGEGTADFRVIAPDVLERAYFDAVCWICGEERGRYAAFVIGPMCAVNRTSAEPPSHPECAGWSACACPFLSRPHASRREAGLPDGTVDPAGIPLRRNPGVALVWASRDWRRWQPPGGGWLYDIGTHEEIAWFAQGREATHSEVYASIESGLPALQELADEQGPLATAELARRVEAALTLLPPLPPCDCRACDWVEGDNGAVRCERCGGYAGEPGTSIARAVAVSEAGSGEQLRSGSPPVRFDSASASPASLTAPSDAELMAHALEATEKALGRPRPDYDPHLDWPERFMADGRWAI